MKFLIQNIQVTPGIGQYSDGFLEVSVTFQCDPEQLPIFGQLNKYYRGTVVPDIQALEKYYEELDPRDFKDEFVPYKDNPELLEWKPKHPSCFDLGLRKFENIEGMHMISSQEDKPEGNYIFHEFFTDCLLVRACLVQLAEMKEEIETGFCRYGNFPEQAGAFRSGEPLHDFSGILNNLAFWWD